MRVVAVGAPEIVHPDLRTTGSSLAEVVDAVADFDGETLLVSRDNEGRSVARAARLVTGTSRFAHLHIPCRATQWALVLGVLVRLHDSAMGGSRAVAESLLLRMRTQVVLSSVTALDRPSPSLKQHVGSYMPGSKFLVDLKAGTVSRFNRSLDIGPHEVVVARSSKPPMAPDVVGRMLPASTVEIRVPDAEWKARRWLEVTSLDVSLDDIVPAALHAAAWVRCEVCDRAGMPDRCLFCEVDLPGVPASSGVSATSQQGVVR